MPQATETASTRVNLEMVRAHFLDAYLREHATTSRVLHAFPSAQADFRPHDRSSTARKLAWNFVMEERMMLTALKGEQVLGSGFPPPPDSWDAILDSFEAQHKEIVARLKQVGDSGPVGSVQFYVGPKQVGDYALFDFLWFMLCDQIHHRGQLSVYVRMAGGKVPSIYGPSADEPW